MIDATHGTNPYNIQLTTLMLADKNNEGIPVAFSHFFLILEI